MLQRTGTLIITLMILVPMPIAGGIPFLLSAMVILGVLALRMHITHAANIQPALVGIFCCGLIILGWECLAALFHYTLRDLELIAARGVWILLGFSYLTLLSGRGAASAVRQLSVIFWIGSAALLVAMVAESMFYPKFELGRQLGTLNIPWPRATGVPQSDGKIGVYMCLASVFFTVAYASTRRPLMLVGLVLAIAPILFTQSRSTLVGLLLSLGFLFLYYLRTTRNVYLRVIAACFAAVTLWQFIAQFDQIYSVMMGEGVFARNVDARSEGNRHAINMISLNPVVGPGAEYLLLDGMHKLEVHSTFFGMGVKSGVLGAMLFLVFIIGSAVPACDRSTGLLNNTLLVCALVAGPVSEHNLYPGYFNEHLWLMAPVAMAIHHLIHSEAASKQRKQPNRVMALWRRWRTGTRARSKPRRTRIRKPVATP